MHSNCCSLHNEQQSTGRTFDVLRKIEHGMRRVLEARRNLRMRLYLHSQEGWSHTGLGVEGRIMIVDHIVITEILIVHQVHHAVLLVALQLL